MAKCSFCNKKAIYFDGKKYYCKEHFQEYFKELVFKTIKRFNLFEEGDKVLVGVSGGKDSVSLLHFLHTHKDELGLEKVEGLAIDEGIKGYRDLTLEYLREFAKRFGIKVHIVSFKEEIGLTLDEMFELTKKYNLGYWPCTYCGVFRRWLLNKFAFEKGYTVLATGHNLNDEAQTVILNLLEHNLKDLAKLGPVTGIKRFDKFIKRVKPFYFVTEKETTIYSIINDLRVPFVECPYARGAFRIYVRDILYKMENVRELHENIVEKFLSFRGKLQRRQSFNLKPCKLCGFPTSREICQACQLRLMFQKLTK